LQAENVAKLDKKLKKNKTDVKVAKARDEMAKDLEVKTQQFEEQERSAVQEIACQERTHYTTFAACLKPLIVEQVAMLREVEQLDGVMDKLNQIIADPFNKLSSSEEILSFVKDSEEVFSFASPRSSPRSSISSRSSSLRSVSSPRPISSANDQDCLLSRPTSISGENQE